MSSLEEDVVGDLDDEVKDYSKLYKDHQDKDDDMLDDRMDTVQVYNEEGTPMISMGNTPMIFSRTSSPDSLDSDCDEANVNGNNGNCSSSSRVSESSIGQILGTVSPSDLPASPGDLFDEHEPEEENNNGSNQVQDNDNHVFQNSGNRLNDKRSQGIRFQPMPSPRKTIIGSSLSRKPLPCIPSGPTGRASRWENSLESPPPLPTSSPPLLCSPTKFTSPPSMSSPPPAVPNRPRPGRPPIPPKPAHLKQNTSGNRSLELEGDEAKDDTGGRNGERPQREKDSSYRINSSSSDSDDDDDDLLADVIYAGIPKRRNKKEDTVVQKDSASSCDQKNDLMSDQKNDLMSDQKNDLVSDQKNDLVSEENGHLSVQEFKTDYLETDIDTVINYDKFLMNQKPSIFHYKSYQV